MIWPIENNLYNSTKWFRLYKFWKQNKSPFPKIFAYQIYFIITNLREDWIYFLFVQLIILKHLQNLNNTPVEAQIVD